MMTGARIQFSLPPRSGNAEANADKAASCQFTSIQKASCEARAASLASGFRLRGGAHDFADCKRRRRHVGRGPDE